MIQSTGSLLANRSHRNVVRVRQNEFAQFDCHLAQRKTRKQMAGGLFGDAPEIGEGGGHKAKAGGYIDIKKKTPAEIGKLRQLLWRRYINALGLKPGKGQKLVP